MSILQASLLIAGLALAGQDGQSPSHAVPSADFYVAVNGSDSNFGTEQQPFATLEKARDAVRAKIESGLKTDVLVLVRGGTYRLSKPLVFGSNDSGTPGHSIVYAAFPGEKPVLSGGASITDWQPHRDGIWKASAPQLFRQLYVNGVRAVRARTPNAPNTYSLNWNVKDKTISVPAGQIANWNNFQQVEMVVSLMWAEAILRLDSFTTNGDTADLVVQNPERDMVFLRPYPAKLPDQAYHFENAYEFLDAPGEWYLDTRVKTLYYKPRKGEDMTKTEVIAPAIETLLRVEGTLEKPVHDLCFRSLAFEHSNWTRASKSGMLNMQAGLFNTKVEPNNKQWCARSPAAVYVAAADRVTFERDAFRHIGAAGIDFYFGTHGCAVVGNVFDDISGNAIQLAQFNEGDRESHVPYQPADPRDICSDDSIRNNYITRVGQDYYGCVAIACGYPRKLTVEHNEIAEVPYTGISVGWGWFHGPNVMRGNRIRYNRIHHFMSRLWDGGAIYTLSPQFDSEIAFNHIYDYVKPHWLTDNIILQMIYLDEGSDYLAVHDNLVEVLREDASRSRIVNLNQPGQHNVIRDNGLQSETIRFNAGLEPTYQDIKQP